MYEFKIICDFRENFESKTEIGFFNDHQDRDTFERINQAIINLGYNSKIWGGVPELGKAYAENKKFNSNTIFINLSDGLNTPYSRIQIPVFCDLLNLKYSGSGPFEVALATNKYYTNLAVKRLEYNTPKDILINPEYTNIDKIKIEKFPIIIKPNCEGSSLGISNKSVCYDYDQMYEYFKEFGNAFPEFLIEEYIPGYDVTNFVIGNEGDISLNELLVIQHHDKTIFTSEVLGVSDHINQSRKFLSAEQYLSADLISKVKNESETIMKGLQIKDICRIDYRITEKGDIYFLEINTVPAIHENSQVGAICKNKNITFSEFISIFINTILKRFNHV